MLLCNSCYHVLSDELQTLEFIYRCLRKYCFKKLTSYYRQLGLPAWLMKKTPCVMPVSGWRPWQFVEWETLVPSSDVRTLPWACVSVCYFRFPTCNYGQHRNLWKHRKVCVLLRACYSSDSRGGGVLHLRRITIFLRAGTMVIVVASLCLTSCFGKVGGCLQADAQGGDCRVWKNPSPPEPGGRNPSGAAVREWWGIVSVLTWFLRYLGH